VLRTEAQQLGEGDSNGGVDVGVDLEASVLGVHLK